MNFSINLFVFLIWLILVFVGGYLARGYYDTQLYTHVAQAAGQSSYVALDGRIFRVDTDDGMLLPCAVVNQDGEQQQTITAGREMRLRCVQPR